MGNKRACKPQLSLRLSRKRNALRASSARRQKAQVKVTDVDEEPDLTNASKTILNAQSNAGTETSNLCRAKDEYCWPNKVLTEEELMNVCEDKQHCNRHFPAKLLPADFPTEDKKNHVGRTYEKKETIDEVFEDKTDVSMYEETVVKLESYSLLHEGYKCDICSSAISGYRYACVQCEDVDLCASCEASGAHAAHYVLRIPRPRPEAEVEELLKELRYILKKRPPSEPPAEKIMIPLKCVPLTEDPLLVPVPPDVSSSDQAESEDGATESESKNENVPDSPQASTSRVHLNRKCKNSKQEGEIVPPKRRKVSHQEITPNSYKVTDKLILKWIDGNGLMDKKAEKPVNLLITLTKKRKSLLEAPFTSEIVQQSNANIEAETGINEDIIKLGIDDEIKCINANTSNKTSAKDAVSNKKAEKPVNLVNTLREKLNSVLKAAFTSETVKQSIENIEAEMEINEDSSKLGIDDEIKSFNANTSNKTSVKDAVSNKKAEKPVNLVNRLREKLNPVLEATLPSETVQQSKENIEIEIEINEDILKLEIDDEIKCINANTSNKTSVKDAVSDKKAEKPVNLVNTLREKLNSVLKAALPSETVTQSIENIEAEIEINEDSLKLEVDDEIKCINANTSNKTSVKAAVSDKNAEKPGNLVNTLREKLNSVLEATLPSETVQQSKENIEIEIEINEDSLKLEVDDKIKCINANTSNKTSVKAAVSDKNAEKPVNLVNTLREKLNSVLEATETVQQSNENIEIEIEINEESVKLEIDDENYLVRGEDIDLGENDGLSDINEIRSRRGEELNTEHAQLNDDDPLALGAPNVQIVTVEDARMYSKSRK